MPHTAERHGRTIILTGQGRQGIRVETRHPQFGNLNRGWIRPTAAGWQPVTPDHEYLDVVAGDYIDAEKALLDATAGLDELEPTEPGPCHALREAGRAHARQIIARTRA